MNHFCKIAVSSWTLGIAWCLTLYSSTVILGCQLTALHWEIEKYKEWEEENFENVVQQNELDHKD